MDERLEDVAEETNCFVGDFVGDYIMDITCVSCAAGGERGEPMSDWVRKGTWRTRKDGRELTFVTDGGLPAVVVLCLLATTCGGIPVFRTPAWFPAWDCLPVFALEPGLAVCLLCREGC